MISGALKCHVAPALQACNWRARPQLRTAPVRIGNPFAGMADMGNMMENMKKAQAMVQEEAAKVQEELATTEFDGYDDEETVRIVFLGNQAPKSVELTQAAMECDADELGKRIEAAMKDAHAKSVVGMRAKMTALATKLGLPPGMMKQQ